MKKVLALLLFVAILLIPSGVTADTDINFHDAITKYYNDNGFPKLQPESPLILETNISVKSQLNVYFMIEPSDDNRPYADPANYKMRIIVRNYTRSYTDLGEFGNGADLTAPTNPLTVVPGFNYTIQMEITFTESVVNINDTFEFSVVIGIETGGGYNPSDSISHIVQFAEPPPPLPPITTSTTQIPYFVWGTIVGIVIVLTAYAIRYAKKVKEKNKGDEDET